ncbi:dihydrofolate reductase family protein [Listeria booriae]|uniref:dihydrofolate reductase family protein n=1 Tax=Listeria booriae TaxID=1552123 RepID=UPI0016234C6D|nr:dihydrofolate reductase family protein [Listeria booriae]MBC2173341.1 dihydrofolate reductase [Listeria booriae]
MNREVILYIAVSVDGYIAEADGSIGFLEDTEVIVDEETSYQELLDKIDTVVLGRTTYDQLVNELAPGNYPYTEQTSYIITSHPDINTEKLVFTSEDPVELVRNLKSVDGKAIWIVGGGSIIAPLVEANLIDSYVITTIPVLLGKGIPLFSEFEGPVSLKVDRVDVNNGLVYTYYSKK